MWQLTRAADRAISFRYQTKMSGGAIPSDIFCYSFGNEIIIYVFFGMNT